MCLKFFGILILDLRWICQLRFIAVFVRSWPCVLVPLLNCLKSLIWLLKYSQSDVLRSISDNAVNIRQHKTLNYIYPRRKKILLSISCMAFNVLCWTYMSPRSLLIWSNVVLFLYSSSFSIHSIQEISILEGVVMEIFSYLIRFLCPWGFFC